MACLPAGPAMGDEARARAEARLQEGVGEQLRAVKDTATGLDDVQLGRLLLAEAEAQDDDPVFQNVLRVAAAPLLLAHPDGFGEAAGVVAALDDAFAADRDRIELEMIDAYEQAYRRARTAERRDLGPRYLAALLRAGDRRAAGGDDASAAALYRKAQPVARLYGPEHLKPITAKLTALRERELLLSRRDELGQAIAGNPADDESRVALILLHTTQLFDLPAATQIARGLTDAPLRERLLDALLLPDPATDLAAAEAAANWWSQRADEASEAGWRGVLPMQRRAFERVRAADAGRGTPAGTRATLLLQVIREQMDEAGIRYTPPFRNTRYLQHAPGLLRSFDVGEPVFRVDIQPAGGWAALAGHDRAIVFDIDDGQPVREIPLPGRPTRLTVSADGRALLMGGQTPDGLAVFGRWGMDNARPIGKPHALSGRLTQLSYVKGRPVVGLTAEQSQLYLLDAQRPLLTLATPGATHMAWPDDLSTLLVVTAAEDATRVLRIDPLNDERTQLLATDAHIAGIRADSAGDRLLVLHPRGAQVLGLREDRRLSTLVADDQHGQTLDDPRHELTAAALTADGKRAALAYQPGALIVVYDTGDGSVVQRLEGHVEPIAGLAFSADGRFLLSTAGRMLHVWGVEP